MCDKFPTYSIHGVLREMDCAYDEWAQKKMKEQNDYQLTGKEDNTRLVYNRETKRFVLVKTDK